MRKIIDIQNVYFSYPQQEGEKCALKDINLMIEEGEFLAVLGANNAGKSTFCKLINGIVPNLTGGKFRGKVFVDGEDTYETPVSRLAMKTGIVFDDPDAQLFTSSVFDEAAFGLENLLLDKEEIIERVNFALQATGLAGFKERNPSTLSGGEKQRLVIAASLAMAEKILVLDEPLSRLDPKGAKDLMAVINEIRQKKRITLIMTSNNCNFAGYLPDRACVLKDGRIVTCDNAGNIFSNSKLLRENGIKEPDDMDVSSIFLTQSTQSNAEENKDLKLKSPRNSALKIINLSYSYPESNTPLFNNFNLSIKQNDFAAIMGGNGCGKTTLFKIITGLLRPCDTSDVLVNGKSIVKMPVSAISKEIGYVMQNPDTQLFTSSVYDEVSFALKNAKLCENEIKIRVEDALLKTGLSDPSAYPQALSREDRTKVVIASVLAMRCKIILFDEVDASLDYQGCKMIMDIARELYLNGHTVVFITHNISLACEYANRLIMIDKNGVTNDIIFDGRRKNES